MSGERESIVGQPSRALEAALVRELGLCYATCAVVANRAAGKMPGEITMAEIERNLAGGMDNVKRLLARDDSNTE